MTAKSLQEHATDLERARREARRRVDREEAAHHSPLRAHSVQELLDLPSPDYLIDRLLPERALAELIGASEALKSFFAIALGMAIAAARTEFFGQKVTRHGPVLYIAAEGAGAFKYRLLAWGLEHEVDITTVPFWTIAAPLNLRAENFQDQLRTIVREIKPLLIVVDTLHRCIPGAEENSSRDLGEVIGFSTKLQAESGAAVLFIHHPAKSDPAGGGRGSSALHNAADTEFISVVEGEENDDGTKVVVVSVKKQKDDSKLTLTLKNRIVPVFRNGRALAYESGRPITSCVLEVASEEDVEAARQVAAETLPNQIVLFVSSKPGSTKAEIRAGVKANSKAVSVAVDELEQQQRLKKTERKEGRAWRTEYAPAIHEQTRLEM